MLQISPLLLLSPNALRGARTQCFLFFFGENKKLNNFSLHSILIILHLPKDSRHSAMGFKCLSVLGVFFSLRLKSFEISLFALFSIWAKVEWMCSRSCGLCSSFYVAPKSRMAVLRSALQTNLIAISVLKNILIIVVLLVIIAIVTMVGFCGGAEQTFLR